MTATEAMTKSDTPHGLAFSKDQIELLKRTVCKGATDDELRLFMATSTRMGLDPFSRQIHAVKRWDSREGREVMAIQVGIDGFRLTAQRSGEYEGQVGPQWCGADGAWTDVWLQNDAPAAARVGALRRGFREPAWGVATFRSYSQSGKNGLTPLWKRMPEVMLAKCAEAQSLRKAFPAELSGVYEPAEGAQLADEPPPPPAAPVVVEAKAVEVPAKPDDAAKLAKEVSDLQALIYIRAKAVISADKSEVQDFIERVLNRPLDTHTKQTKKGAITERTIKTLGKEACLDVLQAIEKHAQVMAPPEREPGSDDAEVSA